MLLAYFNAFSTRFAVIWASRSGSVSSGAGSPRTTSRRNPQSRADGTNPATASYTTVRASTGWGFNENWCASRRARSSRSATRRSNRRASAAMIDPARACSTGSSTIPSLIASAYPRIDVNGVRRSCDTLSRNARS